MLALSYTRRPEHIILKYPMLSPGLGLEKSMDELDMTSLYPSFPIFKVRLIIGLTTHVYYEDQINELIFVKSLQQWLTLRESLMNLLNKNEINLGSYGVQSSSEETH